MMYEPAVPSSGMFSQSSPSIILTVLESFISHGCKCLCGTPSVNTGKSKYSSSSFLLNGKSELAITTPTQVLYSTSSVFLPLMQSNIHSAGSSFFMSGCIIFHIGYPGRAVHSIGQGVPSFSSMIQFMSSMPT